MTRTDLCAYAPRLDALRRQTQAGVAVDLQVWCHYYGTDSPLPVPVVTWQVSTFDAEHKCHLHTGPDLDTALWLAEAFHAGRTPEPGTLPMVVTP